MLGDENRINCFCFMHLQENKLFHYWRKSQGRPADAQKGPLPCHAREPRLGEPCSRLWLNIEVEDKHKSHYLNRIHCQNTDCLSLDLS